MNIEVKDLTKRFDEFKLDKVNINVPKGKIVGLIGENGAGKTTLLKCILGAMHKDSGTIKLFGKTYKHIQKDDVGVVYDDSFINELFNIKDINLIMKNIYSKWDEKLFFKFMKDYNIPMKKELRKLSTGMKKKVEIATAMSHHPKVLILDEPTSGLDPIMRSEVLDMFQDFIDEGNSILLSTHITSDLEHIADDVIFISKGKIIFDKPLKQVKEDYTILELSKDEWKSFKKGDVERYKENRLDVQVLVNKKHMKKEYKKFIKNLTTLDDIMLLYIRGDIC